MYTFLFILGLLIVGILAKYLYDKEVYFKREIDAYGGIKNRFPILINAMLEQPSTRIIKESRNHIIIQTNFFKTSLVFIVTLYFNKVEVRWLANLGIMGKHNHKWMFPINYPEELMLQEINTYIEAKNASIFNNESSQI